MQFAIPPWVAGAKIAHKTLTAGCEDGTTSSRVLPTQGYSEGTHTRQGPPTDVDAFLQCFSLRSGRFVLRPSRPSECSEGALVTQTWHCPRRSCSRNRAPESVVAALRYQERRKRNNILLPAALFGCDMIEGSNLGQFAVLPSNKG